MNTVNNFDVIRARTTLEVAEQANAGLRASNAKLKATPEMTAKIEEVSDWLATVIKDARGVLTQADLQFKNRPQHLLSASTHRMFDIPQAMLLAEYKITSLTESYSEKCKELKKQNFNDDEIKSIIAYPQAEIDSLNAEIANLKAELKGIKAFLADAPRYDQGLIAGGAIGRLLAALPSSG